MCTQNRKMTLQLTQWYITTIVQNNSIISVKSCTAKLLPPGVTYAMQMHQVVWKVLPEYWISRKKSTLSTQIIYIIKRLTNVNKSQRGLSAFIFFFFLLVELKRMPESPINII